MSKHPYTVMSSQESSPDESYRSELGYLVLLHAVAQNLDIAKCRETIGKIHTLEHSHENSWVYQWNECAKAYLDKGDFLNAFQYFNLARFPFPSNKAMELAHQDCVDTFKQWTLEKNISCERRIVQIGSHSVPFYFSSNAENLPLLIVMGGIVSIKEQWNGFVSAGKKLGVCVVLAEMPGVGENPMPYDNDSDLLLDALVGAVEGEFFSQHIHLVMMSFSGNLGLKFAAREKRVKAVTTVGAPVKHFFTDQQWWVKVPLTTKRTLAYLCQCSEHQVFDAIKDFAIPETMLQKLTIPVYYIQSEHDEIIPSEEVTYLRKHVSGLHVTQYPDVHGSPRHMSQMQKWVPITVLTETKGNSLVLFILKTSLKVKQIFDRLAPKK
ncbi:MAG: esterase FrsA [Arenicella sp.]|jgi:esterase FrsA